MTSNRAATVLAGHARAADTPFELLQQAAQQWVQIASGGDNRPGVFNNLDACPCQHTYSCASRTIAINAWPNPVPNPIRGFPWNAPPRAPAPWNCRGNCLIVPTRIWRGWSVMQGPKGQLQVNINTFTQYHCKEPDDPDINKPPDGYELPPKPPDSEDTPPKPGDVNT